MFRPAKVQLHSTHLDHTVLLCDVWCLLAFPGPVASLHTLLLAYCWGEIGNTPSQVCLLQFKPQQLQR